MKFLIQFLFLGLLFAACSSSKKAASANGGWDKKHLELGKVKKGEKPVFFFEFTNRTASDVQVEIVDACDCTKVDFPRGPIQPGKKGRFDVIFDSTEKTESETLDIRVIWKGRDAEGNPVFDVLSYHFELVK